MKKISELVENKNLFIEPYLCGAIFSRILVSDDNKYFIIPVSFRTTKFNCTNNIKDEYEKIRDNLNQIYKSNNKWILKSDIPSDVKLIKGIPPICCIIENDLKISKDKFLKLIYYNLVNNSLVLDTKINDYKRNFIRGFFESKGSIDFNRKLYAADYYYEGNNNYDFKRALILVDYFLIPLNMCNMNFRKFQNDYIKGKKRNDQIRVNLYWYISNIGLSNEYKIKSIENILDIKKNIVDNITYFENDFWLNRKKYNDTFLNRTIFYSQNVLNKNLSETDIAFLRNELGLNNSNKTDNITRNQQEKIKAKLFKNNICAGCNNIYNLKDRSFKCKNDSEYYLEIHHNISFSSNAKDVDIYDNLVKLCPVCHSALRKNRTFENVQKEIIRNIINNDRQSRDFAVSYFNIVNENNYDLIIHNIWKNLG